MGNESNTGSGLAVDSASLGYAELLKNTPKTIDGEYIYLGMVVWYIDECEGYPFESIRSGVVDSIYTGDTDGKGTAMLIMRHGNFEGGNLEFYAHRGNCPEPSFL